MGSSRNFFSSSGFPQFQLSFSSLLLIIIGAGFAEYTYLNGFPIVYTAVGTATAILGAAIMLTPRYLVPKSVVLNMIHDSYANSEAILTQFPAIGSCKYMPPGAGRSFVQVPINGDLVSSEIQEKFVTESGAKNLVNIYLPLSIDTLLIPKKSEMEKALSFVLRDHFEMVKSLKLHESGNQIIVQLNGCSVIDEYPLCKKVLGSEPTSIAGCTLSFILNNPLTLVKEEYSKLSIKATFSKVEY